MPLKLCVAQLNYCVGDMPGNAQKIIDAARTAYAAGARLLLTPELAICGYAAEDLFLRASFIDACDDAVNTVARELAGLKGLTVVVGTPTCGNSGMATTRRAACARKVWRCSNAITRHGCFGKAQWLTPTPSVNCPITRCLTSAATSHQAAAAVCSTCINIHIYLIKE